MDNTGDSDITKDFKSFNTKGPQTPQPTDGKPKKKTLDDFINDCDINVTDSDEVKHQKIKGVFNLSKSDFVEAIFSWIEVNTEELANQFAFFAPKGDFDQVTFNKAKMTDYFLANCDKLDSWTITAAGEEFVQPDEIRDRIAKVIEKSNLPQEELPEEDFKALAEEYTKLINTGVRAVKWTFFSTLMDSGEKGDTPFGKEFQGIVYTNKKNKIIHAFAVGTVT